MKEDKEFGNIIFRKYGLEFDVAIHSFVFNVNDHIIGTVII